MAEPAIEGASCAGCCFRRQSSRTYVLHECRRRAPIMVEHRSSCARWMAPGWPKISDDDWCGEFQAKELSND